MRPCIRSYLFSWIFAPGGRLSNEAYTFLSTSKVPKMYFLGAPASQKGLKGKNTRLKQLSEYVNLDALSNVLTKQISISTDI